MDLWWIPQEDGSRDGAVAMEATPAQTCRENGHSMKRCVAVSRLRMQSGQKYPFGQPRASSLSAVISLFWTKSQAKRRQRGVAQGFQMSWTKAVSTEPTNWRRYAEEAE
jgi:hypothetical protein